MASLKDTVISGSLRVTDTTYTNDLIIGASKTKNQFLGTPYNADGAPTFRALNTADIPTLSITDKTSGTLTVARGGTGLTTASYKNAIITGNGTTVTNAFTVVRTGSGALYATAQDGAAVFGTLPVAQGGTGLTTASYKNAIITGNGTTVTNAFTVVRTASGALYATAQDGAAKFGTLPVAQGGTGATSFTANSLIISGSTTTAALTTRAIYDRTSVNALNAAATWANSTSIPTLNTLTYWDGRYQTTSNLSNLTYLNKRINFPTITGGTGVTAADNGSGSNPRYRPASWKFNASITPIDGDVVTVKKPSALHDYGTWLSLDNGTTWYPIVYANTSRLPDWFSNNYSITLRFDATGTCSVFGAIDTTNKVMLATNARSTITGVWRLWTMYDSGNDLGIRVYNQTSGFNDDYPFLVSRSALSAQIGTNNSNSSSTNTIYGVIWDSPNRGTHNKTPTVNISTGMVKFHSLTLREKLIGTTAKIYGTTLPSSPVEGQVFFQVSDPWYELPPGGTAGQVLTKASNNDRDVSWASPSQAGVSEIANMIYPIGSIYMSVNSTDPSTLFGGTWERLKDRFLLSAGDSYSAGNIGGEATHKLVEGELPSHTHTLSSHTHSLQSHTHSLQSHTHSGPSHTHTVTNGASNGFATFTTGSDIQGTGVGFQVSGTYRAGYSPKTSADGTGSTGGPSNNTSGGPSNNTSGGPSNNTSGSTGSNTAHNNMPPYLVVYMWKRTA